jgi:hypothetical protein
LRDRLGAAAARHARMTFHPERNAKAVEEVYESMLAPAPPLPRSEVAA